MYIIQVNQFYVGKGAPRPVPFSVPEGQTAFPECATEFEDIDEAREVCERVGGKLLRRTGHLQVEEVR